MPLGVLKSAAVPTVLNGIFVTPACASIVPPSYLPPGEQTYTFPRESTAAGVLPFIICAGERELKKLVTTPKESIFAMA